MTDIPSSTTHDPTQSLDIIFGEFRDRQVVNDFVRAARSAQLTGTLYIGYPVLAVDDTRIEFDAVLVSPELGLLIFDLYTLRNANVTADASDNQIEGRQEQLYAALYNRLNSFKELRQGRRDLVVEIRTVAIDPFTSVGWKNEGDASLIGLDRLAEVPETAKRFRTGDSVDQHLNAAIQRISNLRPPKKRDNVSRPNSMGAAIKAIEAQIANLDLWQKRGSIEYVDGPQRIRGLAGSGKTVVLALKAAYLHVKRPDWTIIVTFNTRSLYQQFESLIRRFVYAQINEEPDWERLQIMHAWGGMDRAGVYSTITSRTGASYRDFNTAAREFGYSKAFSGACQVTLDALQDIDLSLFDMILIDEAQDLPTSFFKLVYKSVKDPRRIVWAYDDLQNLGDFYMPSEAELFGVDVTGKQLVVLKNDADQPQEDIVLPRSYRNPPWTLVTAHGVGFGVKHDPLIQIFPDPDIWLRLGYRVHNGHLEFNKPVSIERDPKSVPRFFNDFLSADGTLTAMTIDDRKSQYDWVAKQIVGLISNEELQHTDFLVVIPDTFTSRKASAQIMTALRANELQGHVPGLTSSRDEIFREGSIAVTHIHRAKGNEAPVVFVVDADYCEAPVERKKRRNVLFTAMTRSRAWVYVTGCGAPMRAIQDEIEQIKSASYRLEFHYPSEVNSKKLAASSDLPSIKTQRNGELIDDLRSALLEVRKNNLSFEDMPEDIQRDLSEIYGE